MVFRMMIFSSNIQIASDVEACMEITIVVRQLTKEMKWKFGEEQAVRELLTNSGNASSTSQKEYRDSWVQKGVPCLGGSEDSPFSQLTEWDGTFSLASWAECPG